MPVYLYNCQPTKTCLSQIIFITSAWSFFKLSHVCKEEAGEERATLAG